MRLIAELCFWIGHFFSKFVNNEICADLYIWFMNKSSDIQEKHNLKGPWKDV